METDPSSRRCLLLYTKPARPGGVKTRLIGELSPRQAAEIHSAFLGDLSERLQGGRFHLRVTWALTGAEVAPAHLVSGEAEHVRQDEGDLGARLHHGLAAAARQYATVAAVGSDYPDLERETVERAFQTLESSADAVFGPTADGGYYLVGLRRAAVRRELFDGIPWSTNRVLAESLEQCRRLGLEVGRLPEGHDVDVADDLRRLAERLTRDRGLCPRTRSLLESWGWLNGSR